MHAGRITVDADFSGVIRPMFHLTYQQYLLRAFEEAGARVRISPWNTRLARRLLDRGLPGGMHLHPSSGASTGDPGPPVRYRIRDRHGRLTRVVIDAFDTRALCFPEALDWCDVYYKLNYWPGMSHPARVRPLMNLNAKLTGDHLHRLRGLRDASRSTGLLYWSRLWEPHENGPYSSDQRRNVVEHQLRTFEALARVPGSTDLLAVVPRRSSLFDPAAITRRLSAAGVRVQHDWGAIDTAALWRALASARVVAVRPGFHLCVSWRMTDLLAMGACILCEDAPRPIWHRPLIAGQHFANGGCGLSPDLALPGRQDYEHLTYRAGTLLGDDADQRRLRRNAADYFDANCTPARIGEYLLGADSREAPSGRPYRLGLLT